MSTFARGPYRQNRLGRLLHRCSSFAPNRNAAVQQSQRGAATKWPKFRRLPVPAPHRTNLWQSREFFWQVGIGRAFFAEAQAKRAHPRRIGHAVAPAKGHFGGALRFRLFAAGLVVRGVKSFRQRRPSDDHFQHNSERFLRNELGNLRCERFLATAKFRAPHAVALVRSHLLQSRHLCAVETAFHNARGARCDLN